MANKKQTDGEIEQDLEDKNQVVISPEDVKECEKFFKFFEIPIHNELEQAFKNFIEAPTYQNQHELKFELSEILVRSQHPVFKDEVFAQVIPEVTAANEELAFSRNFEKAISDEDK